MAERSTLPRLLVYFSLRPRPPRHLAEPPPVVQHGYLVRESSVQSHAVRAMAPRGRNARLSHALMLERREIFWEVVSFFEEEVVPVFEPAVAKLSTAVATVVEEVTPHVETAIEVVGKEVEHFGKEIVTAGKVVLVEIDVVLDKVAVAIEDTVTAIKSLAPELTKMLDAITNLLHSVAAAILRAAIGCSPVEPAGKVLGLAAKASLVPQMQKLIVDTVIPKLMDTERNPNPDLERSLDKVAAYEEKKLECLNVYVEPMRKEIGGKKASCIGGKKGSTGKKLQPLNSLLQDLRAAVKEKTLTVSQANNKAAAWFMATKDCRLEYNRGFHEIGEAFKEAFKKAPDKVCPGLGELEREVKSTAIEQTKDHEDREALNIERRATLASLFNDDLQKSMRGALVSMKAECSNIEPSLERDGEAWDLSFERRGGGCGCKSCPCDTAVCLSLALEVSVSGTFLGANGGGEAGCCISEKKFTCFLGVGGGLSVGINGGSTDFADISGSLSLTVLRDIGDVAGHAMMAGATIGELSVSAVWGVGSDFDALEQIENTKEKDAVSFIDEMMSTAFVGVTVSKSISTDEMIEGDINWEATFDDAKNGVLGASIDLGYAWAVDAGIDFEQK